MRTVLLALAIALPACPDRDVARVDPAARGAVIKDIPVAADLDLLFVIDNSASTADKQQLFQANFQHFIDTLDQFPTGRPNLHVGVVDTTVDIGAPGYSADGVTGCPSPDPRDDGLLQTGAACGLTGRFLSDIENPDGSRTTNYTGTLAQAFSCIASVGDRGCGFEAPLAAMRRALDGSRTENAGFVRDGADLAIVFLTDEDDASVRDPSVFALPGSHDDFRVQPLYAYACDTPISDTTPGSYTHCRPRTDSYLEDPEAYVAFLAGVKSPSQTTIAVIASPPPGLATNDSPAQHANVNPDAIVTGPLALGGSTQPMALQPSTSCTIGGQTAIGRPAVRLASFAAAYGATGRFYNVCQPDYSAALEDITSTVFIDLDPCLEGPLALPLDCTVLDVQHRGTATQTEEVVPACVMDGDQPAAGGPRPCWWAQLSPMQCPTTPTHEALQLARAAPPPDGTVVDVQCALAP